jgi:hypothetical protein
LTHCLRRLAVAIQMKTCKNLWYLRVYFLASFNCRNCTEKLVNVFHIFIRSSIVRHIAWNVKCFCTHLAASARNVQANSWDRQSTTRFFGSMDSCTVQIRENQSRVVSSVAILKQIDVDVEVPPTGPIFEQHYGCLCFVRQFWLDQPELAWCTALVHLFHKHNLRNFLLVVILVKT